MRSKSIIQLTAEVDQLLKTSSIFSNGLVISDEGFPEKPQLLAAPPLIGNSYQSILDEIWKNLISPMVGIISIHGTAGVGKTTTMMHINNRLATTEIFDKIIWVTLSKNFSLKKVQDDIAMQLKLYLPTYEEEKSRAARLVESLKKVEKFLIILDDMWEPISLQNVGIPLHRNHKGSKIVVTTRFWNVSRRMETDKYIIIHGLSENEAWNLFVSKAGDRVLSPDIEFIGRKMVQECDNLPILIISLGHAMRDEVNIEVWYKAFEEIIFSVASIQGLEEINVRILGFSFSRLKNYKVRDCFLYCGFFPEDYLFQPEELIRYWMAEDFISEDGDMFIQIEKGAEILTELKNRNMLEMFTKRGDGWLKMHDLFRELAIDIVRKEPEFLIKAGQGLKEAPYFWEWDNLKNISLMRNQIDILEDLEFYCPNISTLLLQDNPLSYVSPSFFTSLPGIQFLDMSYSGIEELPSSLSTLVNLRVLFLQNCNSLEKIPSVENLKKLQVLNLRGTSIKDLPKGMEELVNLRSLDLSETTKLENIQEGVISSLSRLEELQMQRCHLCTISLSTAANCLKEIRCLKNLAILTLSAVGFEDHLDTIMYLQEQNLKRYSINMYGSTKDFI
ncbi:hypothetical protein AQUCO_01200190v1 [Aquilegia coerulea]|uniref:Uncharacterized protein n=1 Tax=Aquilegia coerulea TaxID=218851 RepID=A0A2G5E4X9_AQUCA|nr:hypothetical protein AQUCO_01200190v1 [Aquilegia coerulea]